MPRCHKIEILDFYEVMGNMRYTTYHRAQALHKYLREVSEQKEDKDKLQVWQHAAAQGIAERAFEVEKAEILRLEADREKVHLMIDEILRNEDRRRRDQMVLWVV
ncbi:hypothetical protein ABW19_dt0200349 [Dactylella cylindrospora]|nr:hypothetical protein ABW19_dt0200349 [Dactylella cylindrospora]